MRGAGAGEDDVRSAQGREDRRGSSGRASAGQRMSSASVRVMRAWRRLPYERRLAAVASLALFVTLFLPWYQETVIAGGITSLRSASVSLTGWGAFSFVEAAVLLVAAGVLTLLFIRAEGQAFHVPGGDGGVITAAGLWTCALIIWRMFDKEGTTGHGQYATTTGIEWGIFVALAVAGLLAYSGSRIRSAHEPEPALPGEGEPTSEAVRDRPTGTRRRSSGRAGRAPGEATDLDVDRPWSRRSDTSREPEPADPERTAPTQPMADGRSRPARAEPTTTGGGSAPAGGGPHPAGGGPRPASGESRPASGGPIPARGVSDPGGDPASGGQRIRKRPRSVGAPFAGSPPPASGSPDPAGRSGDPERVGRAGRTDPTEPTIPGMTPARSERPPGVASDEIVAGRRREAQRRDEPRHHPLDPREIAELDIAEPPPARLSRSAPAPVPPLKGDDESDPAADQLTMRLDRPR